MTKRERVINALLHKESDAIPYNITFTKPMAEKMAAYFDDVNFVDKMNNHFYTSSLWNFTKVKKDIYRDEAGVLWDQSLDKDIGVVCNRLVPSVENRIYRLPRPDMAHVRSGLSELEEKKGDKFGLFDIGLTLYERSWTLCGVENLLVSMIEAPEAAHALFEEITQYLSNVLDVVLECSHVDGVLFGDDWGTQRGLIMSKKLWQEFLMPRFRFLYGKVKSSAKFVFHHSCGYIEDIFPDLIDIGLDCYQTFQPEIYDIERVKDKYGRDLSFWGGISTQRLLPYGSPDEVAEKTAYTMQVMGKGGGYIAAPTHDVPGDVPVENLLAMWTIFECQTS